MKKTLIVAAVASFAAFSNKAEAFSCGTVMGKLDCSKEYGPMYKPMYWNCLLLKGSIGGICQVVKLQVNQPKAQALTDVCSSSDQAACVESIKKELETINTTLNKKEVGIEKEVLDDVKNCLTGENKKDCNPDLKK